MSGWGVMNQVAVKEAAAQGFPMDRFIETGGRDLRTTFYRLKELMVMLQQLFTQALEQSSTPKLKSTFTTKV